MSFRNVYGNDWSEAHWRMCNPDECDSNTIPGTNVEVPLRRGAPNTILKGFAARVAQLIEPLDQTQCGGWTLTNDVPTSNHLAGVAIDINWRRHPFQVVGTWGDKVGILRNILNEFEGNVFYGGDWTSPKDEMHFQMGYDSPEGSTKATDFAAKLLGGYLGIYAPPDPDAFPLPLNYFYGPSDWGDDSISGTFEGEQQSWRDGLGRWQSVLGIPATKVWDATTIKAAAVLQQARGWPTTNGVWGTVHEGEWNAVIKEGWRLPGGWDTQPTPDTELVKWGDYSQYNLTLITDAYPYPVVAFRASVADSSFRDAGSPTGFAGTDNKFVENIARARKMVDAGKLRCVIAYHFWVPGADNVGAFIKAIEAAGGRFPQLCAMIDVEDGGAKWNVSGDQSQGVNDWVKAIKNYLGNDLKVAGYLNFKANGGLWLDIQDGLKMIVPRYAGPNVAPETRAHVNLFGHQYASDEDTPPFGPSDINQSHLTLANWLSAWSLGEPAPPVDPPTAPPVVEDPPVQQPPVPSNTEAAVEEIRREVRTILRLDGRPVNARNGDNLFGHVVSSRAEGLITLRLVQEIARKVGVDADALTNEVLRSLK